MVAGVVDSDYSGRAGQPRTASIPVRAGHHPRTPSREPRVALSTLTSVECELIIFAFIAMRSSRSGRGPEAYTDEKKQTDDAATRIGFRSRIDGRMRTRSSSALNPNPSPKS